MGTVRSWILFALLLGGCRTSADDPGTRSAPHSFTIGPEEFLLDGAPFVIRAGELHPARIPVEFWRHRLRMVRAMGCNTVSVRLFWSQHEPRPGEFEFAGSADAARFCRIAREEGLWVLLRPGPYSGAEWDLGGLPAWLLAEAGVELRSRDPRFLEPAKRYLARVGKELAPLQATRGGPILMVQVENEYADHGGDDAYIEALGDALSSAGFGVPRFTGDRASKIRSTPFVDGISAVHFGHDPLRSPEANFDALRAARVNGPLFCGEYYTGWFNSWGKPHHRSAVEALLSDVEAMLENGRSFSLHMAHGGTSFGFTAGASSPPFSPQSTSHDFDAPIDEAGRATPKYHALRALIGRHLEHGEVLPAIPPPNPTITLPRFVLTEAAPILESTSTSRVSAIPLTFEVLGVPHGCVLYRSDLPAGAPGTLEINEVRDFARVLVDGRHLGDIDRREPRKSIKLGARTRSSTLEVLVEGLGRIGHGADLHDRKGITDRVTLVDETGTRVLGPWEHVALPFDASHRSSLSFHATGKPLATPAVYRGTFDLDHVGDTHFDMRGWSRGAIWVNGHALGRYWRIGPQQTLYVPGCWLKRGRNSIEVLDTDGSTTTLALQGLDYPILDQPDNDVGAPKRLRKPGQALELGDREAAAEGTLTDDSTDQLATFPARKGRYVALVAHSSHAADEFTTLAELHLVGQDGVELPRTTWNLLWADSEELTAENGSAQHILDGKRETFWHTEWSATKPRHPHTLVLDLGEELVLTGLRLLPRQDSSNGRIKRFTLYVEKTPFAGL